MMAVGAISGSVMTMQNIATSKDSIASQGVAAELLDQTVQYMKDTAPGPGPRGVVLDRRV